jgi:hypothetical protein
MYGEDSAMVADMYDTHREAVERYGPLARLEALQGSSGGQRRTRKNRR